MNDGLTLYRVRFKCEVDSECLIKAHSEEEAFKCLEEGGNIDTISFNNSCATQFTAKYSTVEGPDMQECFEDEPEGIIAETW